MTKLKLLSVAEDGGRSDRISAEQDMWVPSDGGRKFYISIDTARTLRLKLTNSLGRILGGSCYIEVKDADIDGLITYLQEVKTFLSEEDMIKELMGK
jgi:hypothetical protein